MPAQASFDILLNEPIGRIEPALHGHFAEHLGELIYPGIWVGPDSSIPNVDGLRSDVISALRPLQIPLLRWPGGCFADDYHWRDGIGPRHARPRRVNRHWGHAPEPNHFGTHEFMAFCRALGAEPYFAGNLGSGTPRDMGDWVEYCNFPAGSTLADQRRANGAEQPFGVRYWGIGNENWGCGGNISPEHYAEEYCRFRTFLFNYGDTQIEGIACGPNNADWAWTRRFLAHLAGSYGNRLRLVQGFAAHYYCGTAGTATEFSDDQWLELLARAAALEGVLTGTRQLMDAHDPERKIPLILDEWGAWHPVEAGKPRRGLYQQNTMRDACVAALSLDILNQHADKVKMANLAQLINVLQALLLVEEDRCIRTPTFHVFDLYRPHQGATSLRMLGSAPTATDGGPSARFCRTRSLDSQPFSLPAVRGSASLSGEIELCVTLVNALPRESIEVELTLRAAQWRGTQTRALRSGEPSDHNTFAEPERVKPGAGPETQADGNRLRCVLDPGSVTRILATVG